MSQCGAREGRARAFALKATPRAADVRWMRRLLLILTATCTLAGGLAAPAMTAAPLAGAACASATKHISGTVQGADGRYISSMVGIELLDSAGRKVGLDGCLLNASGYSTTVSTNLKSACCYLLPGTGWPDPTYQGTALSKAWQANGLPSNAASAWIEVYPKRCCVPAGTTNTDDSRYGRALRRPIPLSATSVDVKLPLRCGLSEGGVTGSTGRIIGRVYDNGKVVSTSRVGAWSSDNDTESRPLGWGLDSDATGSYAVDAAAPGGYSIVATTNGLSKQVFGITVNPCQDTIADVAVRGTLPPALERPVAGDWNGDGTKEPGTFLGGTWHLRAGNTAAATGVRTLTFGLSAGDVPVVGDWDGDGVDDVGVYRKDGTWHLKSFATGASFTVFTYGVYAGDVPVVGDWDGDGRDDAGIFRRGGTWYLRSTATGGTLRAVGYGREAGDVPVPGDWDANGADEPGIFRGGVWHLRTSSATTASTRPLVTYGTQAGDRPVPGDWDRDRDSEPGIYRRGTWYLRSGIGTASASGTLFSFR